MSFKKFQGSAVTTLIVVASIVLLLISISAIAVSCLMDDPDEDRSVSQMRETETFFDHTCPQANDAFLRCLGPDVTTDAVDPRIEVENACGGEIRNIVSILSACNEGAMSDGEAANVIEHLAAGGTKRSRRLDL